jgi:hypothetical protein
MENPLKLCMPYSQQDIAVLLGALLLLHSQLER